MMPGADTRAALEVAVVHRGPCMHPKHVANIMWSFEMFGLTPGADAQAALEVAVVRVGPDLVSDARAAREAAALGVAAAEEEDTTTLAAAEEEDTTTLAAAEEEDTTALAAAEEEDTIALVAAEQEVGPSAVPQPIADVSAPAST